MRGQAVARSQAGQRWPLACDIQVGQQALGGGLYTPRAHTGAGAAQTMDWDSSVGATGVSGNSTRFGAYPGLADALYLSSTLVSVSGAGLGPRGKLAGLWNIPQTVAPGTFGMGDTVGGGGETAGRRLMIVPAGDSAAGVASPLAFDITGPW